MVSLELEQPRTQQERQEICSLSLAPLVSVGFLDPVKVLGGLVKGAASQECGRYSTIGSLCRRTRGHRGR